MEFNLWNTQWYTYTGKYAQAKAASSAVASAASQHILTNLRQTSLWLNSTNAQKPQKKNIPLYSQHRRAQAIHACMLSSKYLSETYHRILCMWNGCARMWNKHCTEYSHPLREKGSEQHNRKPFMCDAKLYAWPRIPPTQSQYGAIFCVRLLYKPVLNRVLRPASVAHVCIPYSHTSSIHTHTYSTFCMHARRCPNIHRTFVSFASWITWDSRARILPPNIRNTICIHSLSFCLSQ